MRAPDGHVDTHVHEETADGRMRDSSYSGSGWGFVWKLLREIAGRAAGRR